MASAGESNISANCRQNRAEGSSSLKWWRNKGMVLAAVSLISGALRIVHMFRARAMRDLADRWGLQYIGSPAPKWWNPFHLKISPPLPGWLSEFHPTGRRTRRAARVEPYQAAFSWGDLPSQCETTGSLAQVLAEKFVGMYRD
jgi:hypothetical protein